MLQESRFNLSRLAIKYSRLTICCWLAIAVAGFFAFSSLKYSLFPAVNFPVVVVRAQSSNIDSILTTESELTNPLENALAETSGLKQLVSSTFSGQTVLNVLFTTNISLEDALENVENNLESLALPEDTELKIIPFNLNETSAISYVVTNETLSLNELSRVTASSIIPVVEKIPGVQRVDVLGNPSRQSNSDNLAANNNSLVNFNGQQAIAFQVIKQSEANTLEVVQQVEQQVAKLQLPEVELILAESSAGFIRDSTKATIEALLGAITLAILVIYPFLRNLKATLIAAVTIPVSLLATCIIMALMGFNLETLTLLALALVIGIIVDDAIVEVENIMRHLEAGATPRDAALLATREIGLTVSISTLTIVAVFLPIGLMGGTLGQFFRPFGFTLSAAVLTSLLAARTLVPVLAASWFSRQDVKSSVERRGFWVNSYLNLLQWSLNHRPQVVAMAIASLIAGIALIPLIPQGFIPQLDRGAFKIVYTTLLPKTSDSPADSTTDSSPESSSNFGWLKSLAQSPEKILVRRTLTVGKQIEASVMNHPEVESVYTIAGWRGKPNQGQLYVKLKSPRSLHTSEVQADIRQNLPVISQVTISVEDIPFVETGEDPSFKVSLSGEDLNLLRTSAIAFQSEIAQLPGFNDVRVDGVNQPLNKIIHLDRQRVAYVNANLSPEQSIGNASAKATAIAQKILPPEISLDLEGDSARARKILREFAMTLTLAIMLMLILLYLPFRRYLEPLVIGLSLPLSIVGAMLALLLTQSDFGMISLIGLIFLLGLLDKNAILLLDYANQLRNSGLNRTEAILKTGLIRLRPIIMTTSSTILGMLPIALGWGAGAELRQPMAVAIIGGLFTSSLLSLIVVPILYTLLEDYQLNILDRSK
ncbi:MAG: efflux RND transporter permease subunit [Cyanobacteria bacterium J06621_8]